MTGAVHRADLTEGTYSALQTVGRAAQQLRPRYKNLAKLMSEIRLLTALHIKHLETERTSDIYRHAQLDLCAASKLRKYRITCLRRPTHMTICDIKEKRSHHTTLQFLLSNSTKCKHYSTCMYLTKHSTRKARHKIVHYIKRCTVRGEATRKFRGSNPHWSPRPSLYILYTIGTETVVFR